MEFRSKKNKKRIAQGPVYTFALTNRANVAVLAETPAGGLINGDLPADEIPMRRSNSMHYKSNVRKVGCKG